LFVVLSALTRGLRFFLVAGALNRWGDSLRGPLERHFAAFVLLSAAVVVVGFALAVHAF
jgi:hypothetical protein